jgi:hypothetical protein
MVKRTTAVLKLPKRKALVGAYASSIVNAMTGNASVPNPTPPITTVSAVAEREDPRKTEQPGVRTCRAVG